MKTQEEEDTESLTSQEGENTYRISQEVVKVLRPSEVGRRGVDGGGGLAGEEGWEGRKLRRGGRL